MDDNRLTPEQAAIMELLDRVEALEWRLSQMGRAAAIERAITERLERPMRRASAAGERKVGAHG
jgi:hypothetical protein